MNGWTDRGAENDCTIVAAVDVPYRDVFDEHIHVPNRHRNHI